MHTPQGEIFYFGRKKKDAFFLDPIVHFFKIRLFLKHHYFHVLTLLSRLAKILSSAMSSALLYTSLCNVRYAIEFSQTCLRVSELTVMLKFRATDSSTELDGEIGQL